MQLAESPSLINAGILFALTHQQTCFSLEQIGKECQTQAGVHKAVNERQSHVT